jgi:hypothetical protein
VSIKLFAARAAAATCVSLVVLSPASAITKPQVFSLLEVGGPNRNLGPGTGFDENGPPTLGARFAFTNGLFKWAGSKRGARVGRIEGLCTITKLDVAAFGATVACTGTAFLPGGQLQAQGTLVFSEKAGPTSYISIVGGTGAYAGARGYLKSTELGKNGSNSNDEFHVLP